MGIPYFCDINICKVMGAKYITPKMVVLDVAVLQTLCQSQPIQSGTVETVDRMEFEW